ncbi:protein disulfide isomerase [Mycena rebaudengoi]|nr:protein disulfide isomerase [Mycena rebaudengoi]
MRLSAAVAPSLLALASLVFASEEDEAPSDVRSLTADTFSSINSEPLILVEFFAPWCGHCRALAPHYEEAATTLKEKNIPIAKVDCVDQADLCQAHGIMGYPTLKVYSNGTPADYTGPRKADGIVAYMVKQSLPAVSTVTTSNHEDFQAADKVVVIAYLDHRDDYLFGLSTDEAAIAEAKVEVPAIVVYRSFDFDEPRFVYPLPILDVTTKSTPANYAIYAQSHKPLAYLFLDPTAGDKEAHIAAIKPVASKYRSKMNFVWIDAIKFGDHAKALNLAEPKWPAFVIQDVVKYFKFPFDQTKAVEADGVETWVTQYLDGKLQPELKSEPIPEVQDEPVYVLVGKEFNEVVFDDKKDVFIEFYASWCGRCKRLKPIWDDLGNKYSSLKDTLTIAKMEAQENDLPPSVPFTIQGYPTLKFKRAGTREFIDYEDDRSFESLEAFLKEHAVNSLDVVEPEPTIEHADDAQAPLGAA